MFLLFIYEIKEYMTIQEFSDMYIDVNRGGTRVFTHLNRFNLKYHQLVVNLDIELPRIPCDIVSLDQQDVMGTHTVA